jgi:hypothetical protein
VTIQGLYSPVPVGSPLVNVTSHFYYMWDELKATLIDYPVKCIPALNVCITNLLTLTSLAHRRLQVDF